MPNSTKKQNNEGTKTTSPQKNKSKNFNDKQQKSETSQSTNRPRKRRRREVLNSSESELESELEDCNLEDAIALERKLRKVAKNNSLNDDEMKKLLGKFIKNEHVLALVTLKAEDEIARERKESEQRAIIITDIPSVPKLTRAKARELNKAPGITLPALNEPQQPEIVALIKDDLHSDEDDGEYTFKEEDFISDDDPSTTISDLDSNPCTPQTPLMQDCEESPVKFTDDGCFKIPMEKRNAVEENMRIAARTRSKLCLQETTIEDIQSKFVPPDVDLNEGRDTDVTANDEDWMEFLSDFSKPLNNSLLGDDDDPVNDPEYVATDKVPVDAEELRDVNISKKELTELVAELFEGLMNEGVSLESVDLETPQKFLQNCSNKELPSIEKNITIGTPTITTNSKYADVARQINFEERPVCVSDATISSTNASQVEPTFQPNAISTPSVVTYQGNDTNLTPVANSATISGEINCNTISIPNNATTTATELVAIPIQGHPNHFRIAKVLGSDSNANEILSPENIAFTTLHTTSKSQKEDKRYTAPYDNNFTSHYISIKRHVYAEYIEKFERLRNLDSIAHDTEKNIGQTKGFTRYQHDLLQQQLRIHVQMLTQTYIQVYCHPEFWKLAPGVRTMLDELYEKAATHATFNAWNIKSAINLINQWERDLSLDTQENKDMMAFLHKEIENTNRNTRQVPRFSPRIMDLILNSTVFMYPSYLPRIPFTPKVTSFHVFAPSESLLIALGLDKHIRRFKETGRNISKKASPLVVACKHLNKDTVFGKTKRRIWDQVKKLMKASYYNPVKYYFEHNHAPPVEHHLITFENNTVLPPIERLEELPIVWRNYVQQKKKSINPKNNKKSALENTSYLEIVREAIGENIELPDVTEAAQSTPSHNTSEREKQKSKRLHQPNSITINVNYIFGTGPHQGDVSNLINSALHNSSTFENSVSTIQSAQLNSSLQPSVVSTSGNIVAYNYDYNLAHLEPIIAEIPASTNTSLNETQTNKATQPTYGKVLKRHTRNKWHFGGNPLNRFRISGKRRRIVRLHRKKCSLKKRWLNLYTNYRQRLEQDELRFKSSPVIFRYYKYFKALELYTNLLQDLKMFCRKTAQLQVMGVHSNPAQSSSSSSKRTHRTEDEIGNSTNTRSRKVNRQEENLRNMLLPDSAEDGNRKDAIYAFNFYEKVEEVFKLANRSEDYDKFNNILKSFDPKKDRIADLYKKLEALFLPEYPELAQVFLTFLLPTEAMEIGKFFEHFMVTNMTTFISKLNVYFNKQPAQIRKIYNCLSELSEEPDVTLKKVEERILPLFKGNQFLTDWFLQQFPEAPVPERILPISENVNIKEVHQNQSAETIETMKDMPDSPTTEHQPPCQLRYINGRIFYGSKITLPAKLSFMASKYASKEVMSTATVTTNNNRCLHGIREYGERRLAEATANTNIPIIEEDSTILSEDDNLSKALVICTTTESEDGSSSMEACDDLALRSHALRLNPSFYSNTCFTPTAVTSTPNFASAHQTHHSNANKKHSNFNEELKLSPMSNMSTPTREKRKSPTKKLKSPNVNSKVRSNVVSTQNQPMVIIPQGHASAAVACAKKLKSFIDVGNEQMQNVEIETEQTHVPIIARVKERRTITSEAGNNINNKIESDDNFSTVVNKYEDSEEVKVFPESTISQEVCSSDSRADSSTDLQQKPTRNTIQQQTSSGIVSYVDSDEDCKLDVVATLAASSNEQTGKDLAVDRVTQNNDVSTTSKAFTRDEDKIILIEMKLGSRNRSDLLQRISLKLPNRTLLEIETRHKFLMDFLAKLQGN